MGMLVLLLVSVVNADHSNYASAPASDSFPFEDIKDPNAQCVDIKCFEPIKWNDNKKEVCRSTKARTCKPVQTEVNKSNIKSRQSFNKKFFVNISHGRI